MRFFQTVTTLAALGAASVVTAAPAAAQPGDNKHGSSDVDHKDVHRVVKHLDNKGHLNWIKLSKGRVVFLNHNTAIDAIKELGPRPDRDDEDSDDKDKGDKNKGDKNKGDKNKGDKNKGDKNKGDKNNGDKNKGDNNQGGNKQGSNNPGDNQSDNEKRGDMTLVSRKTHWREMANVLGLAAEAECWVSGPEITNGDVINAVGYACDAFDKAVTGGAIGAALEAGIWVYEVTGATDIHGEGIDFFFQFANLAGAIAHPMTKTSCRDGITKLLDPCGNGGNSQDTTRGGWAWIKDNFRIGFDVN